MSDNQIILFFINRIEVKSYNRRERKDTYNVIGIMKGEIEPGMARYLILHEIENICLF
jgi:hypothetical protein